MRKLMGVLMLVAVVGLVAGPVSAGIYWEDADDSLLSPGDWDVAGNWEKSAPTHNDNRRIGGTYSSTCGQHDGWAFLNSDYTYTGGAGTVQLGYLSHNNADTTGYLEIRNSGNLDVDSMHIGTASYGTGTLVIKNGGVMVADKCYIGSSGSSGGVAATGYMTINNGGSATVGDSDADDRLRIGATVDSTGTLTIDSGGTLVTSEAITVGYDGTGILTVAGTLTGASQALNVGLNDGSDGTLNVQSGGNVNLVALTAAEEAGSSGDITIAGTLTCSYAAYIGKAGDGTLTVQNGGTVTASNKSVVIGNSDGSTGELDVQSGGNVTGVAVFYTGNSYGSTGDATISGTVTCGKAYIGNKGGGTLTINSGGSLTVDDSGAYDGCMRVGTYNGSNGTVTQNGGTVDIDGFLRVGYGASATGHGSCYGRYYMKGGTLIIRNSGSSGNLVVGYQAGAGAGTHKSFFEISGGTIDTTYQDASTSLIVSNNCKFKVVGDDATIGFKGNYSMTSGCTLSYVVGADGVSRIQVGVGGTGTVNLNGGTLELDVSEALGSLTFITLIDKQSTGVVSSLFDGLSEGDEVTLGDFDGATYTGYIGYAGDHATSASSGGNDVVIYDIVPEPATMVLLGLGGIGLLIRRRRRA